MAITDYLMPGAQVFGSIMNAVSTAKTNKAQRELAEYQYSKNLEQWNRENEYNKPVNQVARLKEAGLSPQLQYGDGKLTGNVTSGSPSYEAPTLQAYTGYSSDMAGAAASYLQSQQVGSSVHLQDSQADAARASAEASRASAAKFLAEIPGIDAESVIKWFRASRERDRLDNEIKLQVASLTQYAAQLDEIHSRIANLDADSALKAKQAINTEVDSLLKRSQIRVNSAQYDKLLQEARNLAITGRIDEFYANLADMNIDPGKYGSEIKQLVTTLITALKDMFGNSEPYDPNKNTHNKSMENVHNFPQFR